MTVHDSRARFMYAALGTREMWTGYFRYRMIYFSERCSKPLAAGARRRPGGFCDRDRGCRAQFRQSA